MDGSLEEILNVTMKRLEIIMQDTGTAYDNRAEQLIMAAILALEKCSGLEKEKRLKDWQGLLGYAEELYVHMIVNIPRKGEKDQYLHSCEVMREILACKFHLADT